MAHQGISLRKAGVRSEYGGRICGVLASPPICVVGQALGRAFCHVERSAAELRHLVTDRACLPFAARFLIGYAMRIRHGNNSRKILSFCFFFFLLKVVKLLLLISPGAGSGPQISALRGLSGDRPPHTHSGG